MNDENLIEHAIKAYKNAICPYSKYSVGASILTTDNKIISGFNIESKAYPTTLCAERVAIFSALSQGYRKFSSLAVVTIDGGTPCGGCRQIIHEFAGDITIIISDIKKDYFKIMTKDLLPHPFG
ncbi:MAG: cytidine deaminase [Candidatus Marinimicrobia bacterium]|nr:cytidine deaminase [Candidatus Neomarinimicrobiota bacterium]|tara:strand:- start:6952 stop:7323 length:372 start_codon:yes stop_codon:yes gene_type:complete